MAVKKSKGLGSNPLDRGIFSKTDSSADSQESEVKSPESETKPTESRVQSQESERQESLISNPESRVKNIESTTQSIESRVQNPESTFLNREQAELRGVSVRLPIELIDWIDELVKQGSRDQNKSRIPKEVWFQAALELFQSMPVDWDTVSDEDELREILNTLESRLKNL